MIVIRIIKKFRYILSRRQKLKIIGLLFLMLIAGFMEMLSVSLMIPFVETILDPDKVLSYLFVQNIMGLFGIKSYRTFLVFLSLLMAFIYLAKNVFLLFQFTIQERFVANNCFALRKEIYRSYLTRPYEYYLNAQTGDIIQAISTDTGNAFSVLAQLISVIAELIVSLILLFTVFVISPVLTTLMGTILLTATLFIHRITRARLRYHGAKYVQSSAGMGQTILQSIQGIKEIKLLHCESYFQNEYDKDGKVFVRADYMKQLLSLIPRFMLEAFSMCTFFVAVAILIYRGIELEMLIPAVSGIAMSAIRLLPAMNRISSGLASMTYNEPAVDRLMNGISAMRNYEKQNVVVGDTDETHAHISGFNDGVLLDEVSYSYPNGNAAILHDATMEIKKGSSIGIVGMSGAGKTTVVDVILGLLNPQKGSVKIDGMDILLDLNGWMNQVGYIPQMIFMLDASIRENIAFGINREDIDDEKVWEALRESALYEYVKGLPDGLDTQIGERGIRLSGGQRQRIGIARALYRDPQIIFLDEATSALDSETEAAIMDSINIFQGKKTLVIIAHRLSTIQNCDSVYRVEKGKIIKER